MDFEDLLSQSGEWLRGSGPESDIVISSRVRLARNLADYPFLTRASEEQRKEIHRSVRDSLSALGFTENGHAYVNLDDSDELTSLFLLERHLISRELANGNGDRGVLFNRSEMLAIMVNEEDHLRIQAIRAGFQAREAYADTVDVDDGLDGRLRFAFSRRFGYLTACPTMLVELQSLRLLQASDLPTVELSADFSLELGSLPDVSDGTQALALADPVVSIEAGKTETFTIKYVPDVINPTDETTGQLIPDRQHANPFFPIG